MELGDWSLEVSSKTRVNPHKLTSSTLVRDKPGYEKEFFLLRILFYPARQHP
jgi:hypothetical protein